MACEICGRNNCARAFHSFEEQSKHDSTVELALEHFRRSILRQIDRLKDEGCSDDKYLIDVNDVKSIIESA